jgi:hypothetical protein
MTMVEANYGEAGHRIASTGTVAGSSLPMPPCAMVSRIKVPTTSRPPGRKAFRRPRLTRSVPERPGSPPPSRSGVRFMPTRRPAGLACSGVGSGMSCGVSKDLTGSIVIFNDFRPTECRFWAAQMAAVLPLPRRRTERGGVLTKWGRAVLRALQPWASTFMTEDDGSARTGFDTKRQPSAIERTTNRRRFDRLAVPGRAQDP